MSDLSRVVMPQRTLDYRKLLPAPWLPILEQTTLFLTRRARREVKRLMTRASGPLDPLNLLRRSLRESNDMSGEVQIQSPTSILFGSSQSAFKC